MVIRRLVAPSIDFSALRRELNLSEQFTPAAQREADAVAAKGPEWPALDLTGVAFVTIDPPGSMDLDQAMCLSRRPGGGYRVQYAIADVSAFVTPAGALFDETLARGETIYLPDGRVPLHPLNLSEGAASLLPDQVRPAVVWTIDLDAHGDVADARVERAAVRSRAQLNYPAVQADVQAGHVPEPIALLPEIGAMLIERGLDRGAINLPIPAQEVVRVGDGYQLVLEAPRRVEEYNAQISLLTGMVAARMMLDGGLGLLRTMPAPDPAAVTKLRAAAHSLGIDWPDGASPGRVIGAVDGSTPRGAAFLGHASELMRGAGYTAFDGAPPETTAHGGVGAPYAHVTAPLRRLADRFATEAALAHFSGQEAPDWVREMLPKLPDVMTGADHLASAADRGAIDLAEAVLLQDRVGQEFDAAVLDLDQPKPHADGTPRPPRGVVAIDAPAVRARCEGVGMILGDRVRVRLVTADPEQRKVLFATTASAPGIVAPAAG